MALIPRGFYLLRRNRGPLCSRQDAVGERISISRLADGGAAGGIDAQVAADAGNVPGAAATGNTPTMILNWPRMLEAR